MKLTTKLKANKFAFSHDVKFTSKHDINGNRILKLTSEYGGFSVQTNGNIDLSINADLSNINTVQTAFNSLAQYINNYGTKRQKAIIYKLAIQEQEYNYCFERALSGLETENLISILTSGCRDKTRQRITSLITYSPNACKPYLSRFFIYVNTGRVSYCAGQSYPDEIRYIREQLMKQFP